MPGPIVRSGPTPQFSKNWENVFGKKKNTAKPTAKKTKKTTRKKKRK